MPEFAGVTTGEPIKPVFRLCFFRRRFLYHTLLQEKVADTRREENDHAEGDEDGDDAPDPSQDLFGAFVI